MNKKQLKKALHKFIKQYESEVESYYNKGVEDSHIESVRYCIDKMLVCIESHIDSL